MTYKHKLGLVSFAGGFFLGGVASLVAERPLKIKQDYQGEIIDAIPVEAEAIVKPTWMAS